MTGLEDLAVAVAHGRRLIESEEEANKEAQVEALAVVADLDAEIRELKVQREERLKGHPAQVRVAASDARLVGLREAYKESCGSLSQAWNVEEKTIPVLGAQVTRRTTRTVEVTDSHAAATDLLRRELWAFVKGITVDAKGLRPLVDAGGVQGIKAVDKHSIAVKLEATQDD